MNANEAPLPPRELELSLAPFGQSRMLPRAAYVDPAVHHWERANLFRGGWVCAGRSQDLVAAKGSQAAISVAGLGVLLTRDAKGHLRAFENICRHRGHELLPSGSRSSKSMVVCPYHAWSYELDGGLRGARGVDASAYGCSKGNLDLIPMRAAEWGGWIFVNASGDRRDFETVLGDLPGLAAPWECERLVVTATHNYRLDANWKVAVENYLECYHCPMIHPALCKVSDPKSGGGYRPKRGLYVGGWMELEPPIETMSFDGRSGGVPFRGLSPKERRQVHYVALFPSLLLSLHPDYVMTHRLSPLGPTTTDIECQWLFSPESLATPGFDPGYAVAFWHHTNREDWSAVESVQRGLASERFVPGVLAAEEYTVYDFVHLVASAYLGRPRLPDFAAV
jgi:Rieske 2Fe-2S family protein